MQDDWKVSRKLTLNIGLRYEYVSPLVDNLDRRSTFWPLTQRLQHRDHAGRCWWPIPVTAPPPRAPCAGVGDVLHLDGVSRRAAYQADRNNWAPRFGFAYSMNDKTVIRGGYGIFYTNSQSFLNNFVINRRQPPFAETQQITSSTATPQINIANPFINASAALVVGTQNINPQFKEGYTQHWNLTVQRQLPEERQPGSRLCGQQRNQPRRAGFLQHPDSRTHGHYSGAAAVPRVGHGAEHGSVRHFHLQLAAGEGSRGAASAG